MKLIAGARSWHKLWSVRVALAGALVNAGAGCWIVFQGSVNPMVYAVINMAFGLGVAVVRVISQGPVPK
jgi:hypothetical protein